MAYRSAEDDVNLWSGLGAIALALVLLAVPACGGCDVNKEEAAAILEPQGFTEIGVDGYDFFECGSSDYFNTHFTATGPTGAPVDGVVCCGWAKSCTVRW